jgi:hypothetical protein
LVAVFAKQPSCIHFWTASAGGVGFLSFSVQIDTASMLNVFFGQLAVADNERTSLKAVAGNSAVG